MWSHHTIEWKKCTWLKFQHNLSLHKVIAQLLPEEWIWRPGDRNLGRGPCSRQTQTWDTMKHLDQPTRMERMESIMVPSRWSWGKGTQMGWETVEGVDSSDCFSWIISRHETWQLFSHIVALCLLQWPNVNANGYKIIRSHWPNSLFLSLCWARH